MGSSSSKCWFQPTARGGRRKRSETQKHMKTSGVIPRRRPAEAATYPEDEFVFPYASDMSYWTDGDEMVASEKGSVESESSSVSLSWITCEKQTHDETRSLVEETAALPQLESASQIQSSDAETIAKKRPDHLRHEGQQPRARVHCDGPAQSELIPLDKSDERKVVKEKEDEDVPQDSWKMAEEPNPPLVNKSYVDRIWSPAELRTLLLEAPDPVKKPQDFHKWLLITSLAYELRPAGVNKLLEMVYGSEWELIKRDFYIHGADSDADWPSNEARTLWLYTTSVEAINRHSFTNADFTSIYRCSQRPNESVTCFLHHFEHVWESSLGLPLDYPTGFMMNILVSGLQPRVQNLFKLRCIDWQRFTFKRARGALLAMEGNGEFESSSSRRRRDKRRDKCFHCGGFGHWARDCRANRYQDSSTRMCTHIHTDAGMF